MGEAITKATLMGGTMTGLLGMAKAGGLLDIVKNMGVAVLALPKPLLLIGGLLTAAAVAFDHFHVSADEALKTANDLQASLQEDYGAGSRYDQLINAQETLNELEREELRLMEAKKLAREEEAHAAEQEAFDKFQKEFEKEGLFSSSDQTKMLGSFEDIPYFIRDIANGLNSVADFEPVLGKVISDLSEGGEQLAEWSEKGFELNQTNQGLLDGYNNLTLLYKDLKEGGVDAYTALGVAATYYGEAMGMSEQEAIEASGKLVDSVRDLEGQSPDIDITDNAMEVRQRVDELTAAANSAQGEYYIHFNIDQDGEIPSVPGGVTKVAGNALGTTDAKGGPTLVNELGPELISANGEAWIAGGGQPVVTNLPKGAIVLTAEQTEQALSGRKSLAVVKANANGTSSSKQTSQVKSPSGSIPAYRVGTTPSIKEYIYKTPELLPGGPHQWGSDINKKPEKPKTSPFPPYPSEPSGPAPVDLKEQSKLFKEQIELLKHKLFLMEKEGATEEERIEQIKKIQAEIEKQKQFYYDHGEDENSKYIQDLEKQWWKYEDDLKKLYEKQAGYYDLLFGAVGEKAQGEIDALEKKKQEIQNQNSELQKQVELEKALDELARAKQQKKLVFKDGRMQYVQDVDAVSKAQQRIDEIQNREAADKQIEEIDKQIEKWEEYKNAWDSVTDDYSKKQDLLLLKEKLGVDLEAENWQERLDNLQEYIDKYNELMVKAGHKNADLKARTMAIGGTGTSGAGISDAEAWSMGTPTPASMMSNTALNGNKGGTNITIQNFNPNLPGISDGEGFVKYLRQNFLQQTLQFANG